MLSETEYEHMLDIVGEVGTVGDPDAFAELVTDRVGALMRSDVTSFNDVDPAARTMRFVYRPESLSPNPDTVTAFTELASTHPLVDYISRTHDGSARRISDFWTTDVWHASAIYQRVYAPMGVEHQMSIGLPAPSPIVVGLAVNRYETDFSDHDLEVLDRLRPYLAQGWRTAREQAHLREIISASARALEADRSAVILLGDPIEAVTDGATTELYRFFGRPSDSSPLPPRVERWLESERVHRRAAGLNGLSRPLSVVRHGRRLVLRYLPPADDHADALVMRVSATTELPTQLTELGLTRRETEVLTLLTTGATNAAIAAQLHLSTTTVKHHLDHVYRKLGVTGRVQACAVAMSMIAT